MRSVRICFLLLSLAAVCVMAGCSGGGGGTAAASTNGSTGGGSASDGSGAAGTAKLSWEAPLGDDGAPAPGVAGYKVSFGKEPGAYDSTVDVGPVTTFTVGGLPPGTYFFAVKCYDSSGNESPYSNEASKSIQ